MKHLTGQKANMSTMLMATAGLVVAVYGGIVEAVAATSPSIIQTSSGQFSLSSKAPFGNAVGPVAATQQISLMLSLKLPDRAAAQSFVRSVSDPKNAAYGRYLTPSQFGERFGVASADYEDLISWATSNGLQVKPTAARTSVTVTGSATKIEQLFATKLTQYNTPSGRVGFAPSQTPVMPAALGSKVASVIGLSNAKQIASLYRLADRNPVQPNDTGTGVDGGLSPADLQKVYNIPIPALSTASPQTIALFEQGGFRASDVDAFRNHYGLRDVPVVPVSVNGSGTGEVGGVDVEAVLDIDCVLGTNPNLAKVLVYEDADDDFALAVVEGLTAIAEDNLAQVVSVSYGFDEDFATDAEETAVETTLIQMAAQGQSVFVSSGDNGAYGNTAQGQGSSEPPGYRVSFPTSQPLVTSVGGTTLITGYGGQYLLEEAWNQLGSNYGATGGGVSTLFEIPDYQVLAATYFGVYNGGSDTMRNVPDVAAVASPLTGVSVYSEAEGGWVIIGGTSASSPIWAAFASVINSARVGAGFPVVGFFNPYMYAIDSNSSVFGVNDVYDGSNGNESIYPGLPGYRAGYNYDNTTGLGSLEVNLYLQSMFESDLGDFSQLPGPAKGIVANPSSDSVAVSWTAATNALGYYVVVNATGDNAIISAATTTGTSALLTGLRSGTNYRLAVLSENSQGYGASVGSQIFIKTLDDAIIFTNGFEGN